MHEKSLGEEWETVYKDGDIVTFNIELCKRAVRTKELIYLELLHDLPRFVTRATTACDHYYHGKPFLKTLETLYHYHSNGDF